jgi:hypothetical protein
MSTAAKSPGFICKLKGRTEVAEGSMAKPGRGDARYCISNRRCGHLCYEAGSRRTRSETRHQIGSVVLALRLSFHRLPTYRTDFTFLNVSAMQ